MTKVADMIKGYGDPRGNLGYSDIGHGIKVAGEMRRILNLDLDEVDIATQIEIYHSTLSNEDLLAASLHLNAGERSSWRMFLNYDEWKRNQELKRVDR